MKTGFYPGCSLKGSSREYAESTLALARALEMPLQEIDDWNCCGASSAHAVDKELALALPARVLALAAEQGFDEVVVPCAACYNRLSMTRHELEQAEARAHILEGLIVAVDNLDEVIRLIRGSKTPREARDKLMQRFSLTEIQAQAILDMRLQRLTNLEILTLRKEYAEIEKRIAYLKGILASEKKLMNVIKKELEEIGEKYADARRTQLVVVDVLEVPIPRWNARRAVAHAVHARLLARCQRPWYHVLAFSRRRWRECPRPATRTEVPPMSSEKHASQQKSARSRCPGRSCGRPRETLPYFSG